MLAAGMTIGGTYLLERMLGRGAMGEVWLARHTLLDEPRAIKVMLMAQNASEAERSRFIRGEARNALRLGVHPYLVRTYELGQHENLPYIVMEYIEPSSQGGNLRDWLHIRGKFDPRSANTLLQKIASALALAHNIGLIHRDIKPANILLDKHDQPRLSDFGLTKDIEAVDLTIQGYTMGTPLYLAPEQAAGQPVIQSDIYSLAVVIYELLVGQPPFKGNISSLLMQHVAAPPPPIEYFDANLPPQLNPVLQKALAKNPNDRYRSVLEFAADFQNVVMGITGFDNATTDSITLPQTPIPSEFAQTIPTFVQSRARQSISLPGGKVTLLLTGWRDLAKVRQTFGHNAIQGLVNGLEQVISRAIEDNNGLIISHSAEGAFYSGFAQPQHALGAALAVQRAVADFAAKFADTPQTAPLELLRVRSALHTGELSDNSSYERAIRLLKSAYPEQILASAATYAELQNSLGGLGWRDLGEQRFRDGGQPESLYQLVAPELRTDFPPPMTLTGLPNNLPPQTTSFIGRQTEIGEIQTALTESARAARLLTLTGVGGTGKTRLALQVALEELENFDDGVWFVELAPVVDDKQVVAAFAGALGVREEPKRLLQDSLTDFLAEKHLLLVVDNCEHVVVAVARLVETLLKSCPKIEILATSREGLSLPGEKTYAVPALSLPDLADLPTVEKLLGYGAIKLFVERATAALPTFGLTTQNALAVSQICHRLDGIPLALELAAARIKVLAPEQIFTRLDSAIRLLTTGSQTLPTRQQTIRGAIDWSYDLLTDVEKLVLQRLAVFAGGWSLEAAEKIVTDDMVDEFEVLDWLTKLVDKSLVVADIRGDETRYRLLETIRQYAGEKLAANDSLMATETRRKHLEWFASFGEKAEPQMRGAQQVLWLGRAEQEHDNFLAALDWSRTETDEANNFETGLRLAGALWMYWFLRGHLSLGEEWLEGSTKRDEFGPTRPKIKAKTLVGASQFAFLRGDYREALSYAEEALTIYRTLGDRRQVAFTLTVLGQQYSAQGDFAKAMPLLEEALNSGREVRDKWNIANTLSALGVIAGKQRDIAKLKTYLEESLSLRRETGDQQGLAVTLNNLAGAMAVQGDLRQAAALMQESLNITRNLKDTKTIIRTLANLGMVSMDRNEFRLAHGYFVEALLISRKLGDQKGALMVLKSMTNSAYFEQDFNEMKERLIDTLILARKLGDKFTSVTGLEYAAWLNEMENPVLALRLASAAEAQREIMKVKLSAKDQKRHEEMLSSISERLDPAVYATESEQGRQMTLEGAIAMVLYET